MSYNRCVGGVLLLCSLAAPRRAAHAGRNTTGCHGRIVSWWAQPDSVMLSRRRSISRWQALRFFAAPSLFLRCAQDCGSGLWFRMTGQGSSVVAIVLCREGVFHEF